MANLTNIDKLKVEKILDMGSGYVLDFSNRTFQEFIFNCTRIDIYSTKYNYGSGSKANRLRAFWHVESDAIVGKLLFDLLEYWKTQRLINNVQIASNEQILYDECIQIANKLLGKKPKKITTETDFLQKEFDDVSLLSLQLDSLLTSILKQRLEEIGKCLQVNAALAAIFLAGSTLEGLLLGIASKNAAIFNQSKVSPKDNQANVKRFHEWTLNNLIDVSCDVGFIGEDVKKFSHALRDFRNYIHPHQQALSGFNPDQHTAEISVQVLKAAITDLAR